MQIGSVTGVLQPLGMTARQQAELPQQLSKDGEAAATTKPETLKAVTGVKEAEAKEQAKNKVDQQAFSQSDLADAIKKLNETVKLYKGDLQFTVDDDTQMQIVKVVDKSSKEVIRQIPSPEVIRIAKAIEDFRSILLQDEA
ncbi:MAG: flagellar protein FlaG [Vogesella sp.]|uniref:flagellar protein FlaG n=1 Tax=Vogesella sp. TaxID=1904252 RepID=UPI00391C1110